MSDCIDHAPGSPAVLCGVIAGQYRELLNGVYPGGGAENTTGTAVEPVVNINSVDAIAALLGARPGDRKLCAEAAISTTAAGTSARSRLNRLKRGNARRKSCQLSPVPSI